MTRYDGRMTDCPLCHEPVAGPAVMTHADCLYDTTSHVIGPWVSTPLDDRAVDVGAMRLDLLTALAALQVVASHGATDAERQRALALVKECGERWGMGEEVER